MEFHLEPPTDPDVNLSTHPARATLKKAAAFHQDKEFLRFPVDSILTWVTCSLRSTGITPLLRYYEAVRPWPVHRYFRPRGSSTCAFSLGITGPVLKFRTKARNRVTHSYAPEHRMAGKQVTSMLFPEQAGNSGFGVRPSSISML